MEYQRTTDLPPPIRWTLIAIKQVGFPVVICFWLMYQQFISGKETVKALQDFKEVMISVKETLDQQNRLLRRRL